MMETSFEIRKSTTDDQAALIDLFARAGEGSPTASLWGDPASEADVYLFPYTDHPTAVLLVAESGADLVGYLAGCLDSAAFPKEADRIDRAMRRHHLWRNRSAVSFFARATLDMAVASLRRDPVAGDFTDPRWPAHLHINVVPAWRGRGVADALMRAWLSQLEEAGAPGCYLQTLVENERAMRFFRRYGFVTIGQPAAVAGLRYRGGKVHQVTMVRPASADGVA